MEKEWKLRGLLRFSLFNHYNGAMPQEPKLIAIVEDDPDQRRNYCDAIARKGYRVNAYAGHQQALAGISKEPPQLVIIDIILGNDVDGGFALCRDLLASNASLPVLFLTERVDEIDKISGLRLGAWDYQPKPISLTYLAERVTSLLRLAELSENAGSDSQNPPKSVGDLRINLDAMQAYWRNQALSLTMTEFRMLERLLHRPGNAISYEQLMNSTMQSFVTHNTINTHMRNIRKKIRQIDAQFDRIQNEYGFGYRWIVE